MTLPDFIIGGAPQAGTTALREYLRSHPDIYIYPDEIHYFSYKSNYKKGLGWYEQFFTDTHSCSLIGEKSASYIEYEENAERIYKLIPDVKLIFILRNPVMRVYSDYMKRKREGLISYNLDRVIDNHHKRRKNKVKDHNWAPIERSQYSIQLESFNKFFPKEQIFLLKAEDLRSDREKVLGMVFEFLGVQKIIPENIDQEYNIGFKPRSEYISKIVNNGIFLRRTKTPFGYFLRLIKVWNERLLVERLFRSASNYHKIKVSKQQKKYQEMGEADRRKLEKILDDEIEHWTKMDYLE